MSATAASERDRLTEYEEGQVRAIAAWKAEHPDIWTETFRLIARPVAHLAERAIPDRLAREAIEAVYTVAERTALEEEIKARAGVADLTELKHRPLEDCDRLATQVSDVARWIATVEGAATGGGGPVTCVLDVPILFGLALRTIIRIGHCYGYLLDKPTSRAFVLGVIAAALSGSRERKRKILTRLREIEELLLEETQENVLLEETASLLFQLEIFEWLPGVGLISGAVLNFSAMARTARTARRVFQERWLRENGKVDVIEPAQDTHPAFATVHWSGIFRRVAYRGVYLLGYGAALPYYLIAMRVGARARAGSDGEGAPRLTVVGGTTAAAS
jgi:hypothetical protein